MKVILLEKNRHLGNIGDVVSVKPGFGRNYLIPQGKAASATKNNLARFEAQRAEIERLAAEKLAHAQQRLAQLVDQTITIMAKVGEEGRLFGSIGTSDIATAVTAHGVEVTRAEVRLPNGVIRLVGEYQIDLHLHHDVTTTVKVVVAAA